MFWLIINELLLSGPQIINVIADNIIINYFHLNHLKISWKTNDQNIFSIDFR